MSVIVKVGANAHHAAPLCEPGGEEAASFGAQPGISNLKRQGKLIGYVVTCSTESGAPNKLDWYNFETRRWDPMPNAANGWPSPNPFPKGQPDDPHFISEHEAESRGINLKKLYDDRSHHVEGFRPRGVERWGYRKSVYYMPDGPEPVMADSKDHDDDYEKDEDDEDEDRFVARGDRRSAYKSRHSVIESDEDEDEDEEEEDEDHFVAGGDDDDAEMEEEMEEEKEEPVSQHFPSQYAPPPPQEPRRGGRARIPNSRLRDLGL